MKSEKTYVLEEQEHLENLRKIIKRDFFSHGRDEEQTINMSLNDYIAHFKSNQSQIFSELVRVDGEEWLNKNQFLDKCKLLMLQSGSQGKEYSNMIGANEAIKAIDYSHVQQEPQNGVFFNHHAHTNSYLDQSHHQAKKIYYGNCSVDHEELEKMKNYQIKKCWDPNQAEIPGTPLLEGRAGKAKKPTQGEPPCKLVEQASPEPEKVPILTWGHVENTPMRLKEYAMPQASKRDEILNQLNSKITREKIINKTKKEKLKMKILSSVRPNASSIRKASIKRYESVKRQVGVEKSGRLDGLLNFTKHQ